MNTTKNCESMYCIPVTYIILCINSTSIKKMRESIAKAAHDGSMFSHTRKINRQSSAVYPIRKPSTSKPYLGGEKSLNKGLPLGFY